MAFIKGLNLRYETISKKWGSKTSALVGTIWDYLHKIPTTIMPSAIESHQRTLNKDCYGLLGLYHTGVCQEAVCTSASFECAGLKCCCFTFCCVNKLFEGLLWPIHLLFWGFFVRNLSLSEKPRNTAVVQLVHYDGKDELRNSAVI